MGWNEFPAVAGIVAALLIAGSVMINVNLKPRMADLMIILSITIMGGFIFLFWQFMGRPPLRTLGETRLWYSFFLALAGFVTYKRWKYKWIVAFCSSFTIIFLFINYLHPEAHDKTLMPALQSPWFAPHVIVYILAYAILAASALVSLKGLYEYYFKNNTLTKDISNMADNLVYVGFAFLTLGLVFGAMWAKEAWGHYWTWDPKETWALLTWLGYLIYIHIRLNQPNKIQLSFWMLSLAFVVLIVAWFGINYLPSAQNSVHVYSRQ
jgi:ABC-type transport system involved in cytochrome c biogenesis permease subunit